MSYQLRGPPKPGEADTHKINSTSIAYLNNYDPTFDVDSIYTTYKLNNSTSNALSSQPASTMQSSLMFLFLIVCLVQMIAFFHHYKRTHKKRDNYQTLGLSQRVEEQEQRYVQYNRLPAGGNLKSRRSSHPSPKHPALGRVPTFPIRLETMKLLRIVGIRLVAHGIQSKPRRVWISIDDRSLVWQSEFKTKLPNNVGASSLLSVRGPVHRIDWGDVKYIDVGKHTDSLKRSTSVKEGLCFSLLTLNGSLDLQAKSQLERDSLVSCLGSMLDEYNGGEEWRTSYYNGSESGVSMVSSSLISNDSIPASMCPDI
jgi:hypothetical protein